MVNVWGKIDMKKEIIANEAEKVGERIESKVFEVVVNDALRLF